jgi:hypothetical protein
MLRHRHFSLGSAPTANPFNGFRGTDHSAFYEAATEDITDEGDPLQDLDCWFEIQNLPIRSGWVMSHPGFSELPRVFADRRGQAERAAGQEKAELFEQIGRLKMELEWLKKNRRHRVTRSADGSTGIMAA